MTDMKLVTEPSTSDKVIDLNDHICQLAAAKAQKDGLTAYQTAMFALQMRGHLASVGMFDNEAIAVVPAAAPVAPVAAPAAPAIPMATSMSPKRAALLPNPLVDMSNMDREARIASSVTPDNIFCLECGVGHKMLKRHLNETHGLNEAEYRARWNLSVDYPLVAPSYSALKTKRAKAVGFGKHART